MKLSGSGRFPGRRSGGRFLWHLSDEAVSAWHHVVGPLTEAGTLEYTVGRLVEAYAINVSVLRAGNTMISKVDEVDMDDAPSG